MEYFKFLLHLFAKLGFVTSNICEDDFFGSCSEKKQVLCENQCGTGNEGGGVQSDSKIWEAVCPNMHRFL